MFGEFTELLELMHTNFPWTYYPEMFVRIIVATLCGLIIGLERTKRQKAAGIRTHCVIAAASAVMMILSKYAFADITTSAGELYESSRGADVSRIASKVVSGVGFLGDGQVADEKAPRVIVTIGRTYGSEGASIGRALAEALKVPYYDGEILEQAAKNSGLSMRYLEHVDENLRSVPLVYNIAPLRDVNRDAMEDLRRTADEAQSEIILQAAQGPCVIIGRRADQVLWGMPNVVRVFITARMEDRVRNVSESQHLDAEEAEKKIREIDRYRAEYYSALNGRVWGQADNYDLCLNVSAMGEEGAIYMMQNAVNGKLIQMEMEKAAG